MNKEDGSALRDNPFAALFPSLEEAAEFSRTFAASNSNREIEGLPEQVPTSESMSSETRTKSKTDENDGMTDVRLKQERDCLVERIFLLTDDKHLDLYRNVKDFPGFCAILEAGETGPLHETIEQLLFNRLLLQDPTHCVVRRNSSTGVDDTTENEAKEDRPLIYLLQCFNRLLHEEKYVSPELMPSISQCRLLIVRNISTALISPELFEVLGSDKADVHQQFYDILASNCLDASSPPRICLYEVAEYITLSDPQLMTTAISPLLTILSNDFKLDGLLDSGLYIHMTIFEALAGHPGLASVTVDFKAETVGALASQAQSKTLLEIVLGKSCLIPDPQTRAFLFFEEIRRMGATQVENEEYHLQTKTDSFHSQLFAVIRTLLKHEGSRSKTLQWIGEFIARHDYLAKMWTHEQLDVFMNVFGPDGALLNLGSVLARLCLPFCPEKSTVNMLKSKGEASQPVKFLTIDASYTYATGQPDAKELGVHGINLHKDTCLQSVSAGETRPLVVSDSYNLISEIFFLAHRALYLGVHGLIKKFYRLNRSLNRDEDIYRQVRSSGNESDEMASRVLERYENGMRIYLSIKGTLTEPTFLQTCMRLYGTTAQYLNQVAVTEDMTQLVTAVLPLPDDQNVPSSLYCIPEYVVENVTDIILYLWRFERTSIYLLNPFIHDFLLAITIYMGNKTRMSNPHLRASLAEVLHIIMPLSQDGTTFGDKEEIFDEFPHISFLTIATLQLFVDIEFTGDPHQFEQKFHYRQPLYKILKYLWKKDVSNNTIKEQVKSAIVNIENPSHPLFLQFTNLLLNDSIYLLDEAMGCLTQIKVMERAKEKGEWEELSPREKMEKEAELKQLGMMAKYHNVLSNDTMDTLVYLTEAREVKDLFSHPSLVDRVAAMMDDFLLKLVGPKVGALRVRDLSAYKFQPKVLVVDLCQIYINLCQKEEFCRAISRDGRSYSTELFPKTCQVLRRIGNEDIRQKMLEVSERVKEMSNQEEEEEEMFLDAPDEFFDALMSTLMRDPIILPASQQVVDRSTISRHLMSDPTDPFNRSPLTMQEVIPNTDLKIKIERWMQEKRKNKSEEG